MKKALCIIACACMLASMMFMGGCEKAEEQKTSLFRGLEADEMFISGYLAPWPEYDEAKAVDATIEIAVQFNGKVRGTVKIAKDADKESVFAQVRAELSSFFEGKTVIKEIYVPGKIVNIVVK